jgi:hypothetical protein
VTVTINAPAAPTGTAAQTFCNAATVANLTATGSSIQWYAAPTGGTALAVGTALTNGSTYYATQTLNNCESANRFAVTVTINVTAAPTGTAAQTFCNAATVADLTATGSGIQWYSASSGGTALAVGTALTDGSTYFASQTLNNCESTNRFAVTVTINVTPAPTGTAAQTFCNSATVADLTATGSGIQWYAASSGGTALTVGTALTDGSTYFASQTLNNCESGARLAVVVTINSPAAPSGSSTQIICGSGTLADLVLSGSSVTWFDASSGGNVLSPSTVVSNGSTYHASQTVNGCESLNRLAVTVTINAIPAAPTGNAAQTFCNGATVADLVATGAGLNWYSASTGGTAIPAGTILTDGSSYFASQTVNGCESTDRLEVVVTVNSPAAPTGNTTQSFCSAATVNDLTATGSSIVWYTAATGGTPLAGSTAITTGTYFASQTLNGCESLNRLAVTVTVTILDATVNQSGSTLTAVQSGASYTWLDCNNGNQPIAGATGQSFTPTANGSYAVEINLNGCSVVSACFQVTLVGMEEDKLSLLEIRPNPTHGILMITVSEPTTAVVTAANGVVVAKLTLDGDTLLDASEFAMGIYLIRTAEGKTAKFVKQ